MAWKFYIEFTVNLNTPFSGTQCPSLNPHLSMFLGKFVIILLIFLQLRREIVLNHYWNGLESSFGLCIYASAAPNAHFPAIEGSETSIFVVAQERQVVPTRSTDHRNALLLALGLQRSKGDDHKCHKSLSEEKVMSAKHSISSVIHQTLISTTSLYLRAQASSLAPST